MIYIKKIIYAGGACPYQLEAETEDGKWFYLRYRSGMLRYVLAESEYSWAKEKKDNWYDFSKQIGDPLDGYANHEFLFPHIKDHVKFPDGFKLDSYENKNS